MEIYCKDKWMLHNAIFLAKQLDISTKFCVVNIKRLPPTMPQKGLIEFSKSDEEIDIFIKYDNERFRRHSLRPSQTSLISITTITATTAPVNTFVLTNPITRIPSA